MPKQQLCVYLFVFVSKAVSQVSSVLLNWQCVPIIIASTENLILM